MKRLAVLLLAVALALAGCGSDDGGGGGDDGEVTTLKVGVLPISPVAPLYLAIDKGFFEAEKLRVEPKLAEGGAAIVPSVMSGEYQAGFSNAVSLMIALERGLDVRVIGPGESSPGRPDADNTALMTAKGGPIRDAKQLEGKTVAVNTLKNISGLAVEASLEKHGVDPQSVKQVEVAYPDMQATVERGEVDAALFNEPFTTAGEQAGLRVLSRPYAEMGPDLPIAPYFAAKRYIDEHGDVIERFRRAMEKAARYAQEHPDALRAAIRTYTKIPPRAIERMHAPVLGTGLDERKFQELADVAQRLGYIKGEVDVNELVMGDER